MTSRSGRSPPRVAKHGGRVVKRLLESSPFVDETLSLLRARARARKRAHKHSPPHTHTARPTNQAPRPAGAPHVNPRTQISTQIPKPESRRPNPKNNKIQTQIPKLETLKEKQLSSWHMRVRYTRDDVGCRQRPSAVSGFVNPLHMRQSRPEAGPDFQEKVLKTLSVVPSSLGRGSQTQHPVRLLPPLQQAHFLSTPKPDTPYGPVTPYGSRHFHSKHPECSLIDLM